MYLPPIGLPIGIKLDQRRLCGSCNGLICVTHYNGYHNDLQLGVMLWNPSLNQYWRLPDSPASLDSCKRGRRLSRTKYFFGFGYDETRDDYKVVRLVQTTYNYESLVEQEIKVYSMKSNSWKSLDPEESLGHSIVFQSSFDAVLANHSVHWVIWGGEKYDDCERHASSPSLGNRKVSNCSIAWKCLSSGACGFGWLS
ncbi:OLC1v1005988C1 [Oldenlandia corymbosa var. corymbosa]|uniref:OLC1v1005988C1 n=1 Tax=Oldenlandia corymbosa var. corymbosa TaxID=529605 RepID=A0AAV1DFW4_OLDCO|nr:OLC1v1005988C1 [Oldenlandia corymbosa var. corymbosa]